MNTSKLTLTFALLFLNACQAGIGPSPAASPPLPTSFPSAVPTVGSSAVPIDGQSTPPVFSTSQTSLCPGDVLTIRLERSNLNRRSIPIVFQYHPRFIPGSVDPTPEPDLPKDPVQLGQMQVSPTGEGEFRFTLHPSYVSRSGAKVELKSGDSLSLYAELGPGSFARIDDLSICPPAQPIDPNAPPTPRPSAPVPSSEPHVADHPSFPNQKLYTVSDRFSFSTLMRLEGRNGLIYWVSDEDKSFDLAGKAILDLKPAVDLPQSAVPDHLRLFPVFNEQGNGFMIWKPRDETPAPGSSHAPYIVSVRPLKRLEAQNPMTSLKGAVTQGNLDADGNGSLFEAKYPDDAGPTSNDLALWRIPIERYQLKPEPERLVSLPSSNIVVETDGSGKGFVLWRKHWFADPNPPYDTGLIYLDGFRPTGEAFSLPRQEPFVGGAASVHVQNGFGSISIPEVEYQPKRWRIYPVRNYRVYPQELHVLTLPEAPSEGSTPMIKLSSEGNGLYILVDRSRDILATRIENFKLIGPTYRLFRTRGQQTNYAELVEYAGLELNESGDGVLFWQQIEIFKDQQVETEPSIFNSHRVTHVYMRPIRGFQSW